MPHPRLRSAALLLGTTLALARPGPAQAFSPYLVVPEPAVAEASPAYRYANLSDADALAELDRRKIVYTRLDAVAGVRAPVRLTARLHGVNFHSSLPPEQRVVSPYEILDARLALALDDFAALLERHEIDEVIHFSLYRPNVAPTDHAGDDEPRAMAPLGRARATQGPARPAVLAPVAGNGTPPVKAPVAVNVSPSVKASAPAKVSPGKTPGPAPIPSPPSTSAGKRVGLVKPQAALGPKGTLQVDKGGSAIVGSKQKDAPAVLARPAAALVLAPPSAPEAATSVKRPASPIARREMPATAPRQTWAPPGTRHPAGLAIDVGLLHTRAGRWLSVARDFDGHLGDKTCGEGASVPTSPEAKELRALVCEAMDLGIFTYVLTPNYNAAHGDHFHMEIKPGVRWFLTH